jgi:2-polyprenyl-3-methyl-5-hydroxy-6-metoxy-1,4-benzoquinol methylase
MDVPDGTQGGEITVEETRELWDRKAAFWDCQFGEGNEFQKLLLEPATLRLLKVRSGQTVLDIATGNGAFARHLARHGVQVVAFDFSPVFIERAQAREEDSDGRIEYRVVDATNEDQLLSLGERRFDAAVATMALMDMPDVRPLANTLVRLLKPEGHLVFSVQHPCFNSNATQFLAESIEREGRFEVANAMKISQYLHVPPGKGGGMPGEPTPHYYFHRPLSELFGVFFQAGFVLDGFEEPTFPRSGKPLTWGGVGGQIPPALVARMRLF